MSSRRGGEKKVAAAGSRLSISEKRKSVVPKDALVGKYHQRLLVMDEIVLTEDHYVHDLEVCVAVYLKPLRESGLLPSNAVFDIFSNMELLLSLNRDLSKKLTTRVEEAGGAITEDMEIADLFINYAEQLVGAYSVYCNQHWKALDLLVAHQKKSEKLAAFLETQRTSADAAEGLSLRDFLIKPVQRICKYPLLFRELFKNTSEDHADWENLRQALSMLEKVTTLINERKREAENEEKMTQVTAIVSGFPTPLKIQGRWFVKSGVLTKYNKVMKPQPRMFFLFSDLLIYCAEKGGGKFQYKGDIPLDASLVTDIPGGVCQGKEIQFGFQVMRADTKRTYPLAARSESEMSEWIKAIDGVIQKSFAKMKVDQPATAIPVAQDVLEAGLAVRRAGTVLESSAGATPTVASVSASAAAQSAGASSVSPAGEDDDAPVAMSAMSMEDAMLLRSLAAEVASLKEKVENGRLARQRLASANDQLVKDLSREQADRLELEKTVVTLRATVESLSEQVTQIARQVKDSSTERFYTGGTRPGSGIQTGSQRDLSKKSGMTSIASFKEALKSSDGADSSPPPAELVSKKSQSKRQAAGKNAEADNEVLPPLPSRD